VTIGGPQLTLLVLGVFLPENLFFSRAKESDFSSGYPVFNEQPTVPPQDALNVDGATTPAPGSPSGDDDDDRQISISDQQLPTKFKHASDFGVNGNYNLANRAAFRKAIWRFVADESTTVIQGTYRGEQVTLFFNRNTSNVVIRKGGDFLSGFRLNPAQAKNVIERGSL
jgi:hypothetical protein